MFQNKISKMNSHSFFFFSSGDRTCSGGGVVRWENIFVLFC